MKNNMIALGCVMFFCMGFVLGNILKGTVKVPYMTISIKKKTPIIEKISPADRPCNAELILVHRDHEMKKGQFVYISGIENEYLKVKKLEAENFPPPETPIYVVHSFYDHYTMFIKLISK